MLEKLKGESIEAERSRIKDGRGKPPASDLFILPPFVHLPPGNRRRARYSIWGPSKGSGLSQFAFPPDR